MLSSTISALALAASASAHIVISYPGWRGNSLITNKEFPYGMQWTFPCGGTPLTTNRTYWPTTGGAVAFQPGWFQGHATAEIYVNIGFGDAGPDGGPLNFSSPLTTPFQILGPSKNPYPGTVCLPQLAMPKNVTAEIYVNIGFGDAGPDGGPLNFSSPLTTPFQILGPSKNPYPGTVCLPQLAMPKNVTVKAGDNATIQVIELAMHGAALYSCVDITFLEPGDDRIAEVNDTNCFNSTDIGAADIYTVTMRASGSDEYRSSAVRRLHSYLGPAVGWAPLLAAGLWMLA